MGLKHTTQSDKKYSVEFQQDLYGIEATSPATITVGTTLFQQDLYGIEAKSARKSP